MLPLRHPTGHSFVPATRLQKGSYLQPPLPNQIDKEMYIYI